MTVSAAAPIDYTTHPALAPSMAQAASGNMQIGDLFGVAAQLQEIGLVPAAISLYHVWLQHTHTPLAYAAWFNLACLLNNENDMAGAEHAYRTATSLNPGFIEARLNLGTLLERLGRTEEALDTWRAILGPDVQPAVRDNQAFHLQTLNNLGRLLEISKQYPAAEAMLADSLRLKPDQPHVMTHWVHLRQKQCKWPVYSGLEHISVQAMMDGTSALAMLSASDDPAQQLAASRRFVTDKVNADVAPLTGEWGYGHQRLRIGYLSSDFCSHAVSILTAELYELHDRSKVEVYAFSWSREDHSPIRARVVKAMDHYIRIDAMSDEQAARCIRDHEIDILVDLHGLTLGARPNIIAFRPAPVQLTYLGFPGSTGLPGIDYVLADEFLIPPALAAHFTEKPLYLPDTFQINDRQRQIGVCPSRASVALPEDAFVFCSFNNNFKFTSEVFAVWMRILQRVPNSVLWLVADYDEVRGNLWRYAEAAGVARERLIFAGRAVPAEYLARYQLADLFLDTYPFNAGTTASDALWAGLPLLTCAGNTFSSRMAGSLLRAVDLPELVTFNFADYEEKAVALANDRPRIAAMKQQLRDNRLTCALFDSPRFVRNLETVLLSVAKPAAPRLPRPRSSLRAGGQPLEQIPFVTLSDQSPERVAALLASLRRHYRNPVYLMDCSQPDVAEQIRAIAAGHEQVEFIPFGYPIEAGPALSWAIHNLDLRDQVLFLDASLSSVQPGWLESLRQQLRPGMYGVGQVLRVDEHGTPAVDGALAYLNPACMLANIEVMRQWPLPIRHPAPLLATMRQITRRGATALLGTVDWIGADLDAGAGGGGTAFARHLQRAGHVVLPRAANAPSPLPPSSVDTDLMALMPPAAHTVVQLGCRDGAFAQAFRLRHPVSRYLGIERAAARARQARQHCDFVFETDIEQAGPQLWSQLEGADCWVLDEVLDRLRDPWSLLHKIRATMAPGGTVVVSLPNLQHWGQQARLNSGNLRYQDGALDPDRLRLFTRGAILDLFQRTGFQISGGSARIPYEAAREKYLPAIRLMAEASGMDPAVAVEDALPTHYLITAVAR